MTFYTALSDNLAILKVKMNPNYKRISKISKFPSKDIIGPYVYVVDVNTSHTHSRTFCKTRYLKPLSIYTGLPWKRHIII